MKYTLKLIFLKCIFEFMINTAPTASNSVYGREKLFWYDKINLSYHACHCGTVVKELLACADKPGSTPGDAVFCFFVPFFFPVWSLFKHYFSFWPFFLYSHGWPCWSCTWINDILSLSPEFYFGKGLSKALDLHTGQAYDQIIIISPVKTCPSSELFSVLVDIMTNNTQYTRNCTNLHPTPTSDPLAKVKLAFCTHRLNHQYYYKIFTGFAPKK